MQANWNNMVVRQVDIILQNVHVYYIWLSDHVYIFEDNMFEQNPICLVATFIFLGVILTNKNHTVARFRRTQPLTGINKHRPLYFTIHHDPIYSSCTTSLIIYISLILKSMICFLELKQRISYLKNILFLITKWCLEINKI